MKGLFIVLLCVAVASAASTVQQKRDAFGRLLGFPEGRVVGGHDATPPVPHIVSLKWVVITAGAHLCGGCIISNEWVLTAAHCILGVPGIGSFEASAGRHNIGMATEPSEQRRMADHNYVHPDYAGDVNPHDIGLIHFPIPFVYNAFVSAMALPPPGSITTGDATLYGWGSTSTTALPTMPDILQTVTKPILPMPQCEAAFGGPGASPLHPNNLCTGPLTGGISACSGDSGGPLIQHNLIIGIVSWGVIPCGSVGAPSVYVRVSAYIPWINLIISGHN